MRSPFRIALTNILEGGLLLYLFTLPMICIIACLTGTVMHVVDYIAIFLGVLWVLDAIYCVFVWWCLNG